MRNIVYQDIIVPAAIYDPAASIAAMLYGVLREVPRTVYGSKADQLSITVWVIGDQVHISGDWFSPPVVLPLDYVCSELRIRVSVNMEKSDRLYITRNNFLQDVGYE